MSPRRVRATTGGLRARKKQATRDSIENAALSLFERQGYDHTTLAEIADAAGVAPRTIFSYFESKQDIVFSEEPSFYARLEDALSGRRSGTTTMDTLRGFLASVDGVDTRAGLRRRIIAASKSLRAGERGHSAPLERILAASIARDLDAASADDLRPVLAAAAATSAFAAARSQLLGGSDLPLTHEETLRVLDLALTFLRGGLEALRYTS